MKTRIILSLLTISLSFITCTNFQKLPTPTEIFENEEGEQEGGFRAWFEQTRKAALGDRWEQITFENLEKAAEYKKAVLDGGRESFAGGLVQGNWVARGASNVAGNTVATYFYPSTEEIYTISSSGSLYKGGLTGGAWNLLNSTENFNNSTLLVVPNGGGKRIITTKSNQFVYYSDNEGATWTAATGLSNPYSWGYPDKLIVLNNGIMYYLQYTWMSSPWGSGYRLNRSTDNGASWTTVQTFGSRSGQRVAMWSPFESNELYVLDNGTTLYTLSGTASTLSVLNTCAGLPTGADTKFSGYKNGSSYTFYALTASANLYKSTDNGANWSSTSTLNPTAWGVGIFANPWVNNALYYGCVNFRKSSDGGSTFTDQNGWASYYGNNNLLHADMVSITAYKKTDGTQFILIGCHGGIYYFPAPFTSTSNLTLSNFDNTEYYDVVTVSGIIFAGSQDQGNQRFSGGAGLQTASQLISGDYVRLNTSVNGTKYWQEYPDGVFHYYNSPLTQTGTSAQATVYGTNQNNRQQWVVPTCNYSIASENSILVGGGAAVSGGTTSNVIKLTYNGSSITKYEYPFDFKAASGSYITALDHSPADANNMYVATSNGKFYYSWDAGSSWTATAGFTGATGGWNYGSYIHASRINKNRAYFCGGGGAIYKTTDGGLTMTSISSGLPNTFVSEVTTNASETLLFAATDAGPYVCVLSTGTWHSLIGGSTPIKNFTSVEYIASSNIARFTTFGRGVWDFEITAAPLPINFSKFDVKSTETQSVSVEWQTALEKEVDYFEVEKSIDGVNFYSIKKVDANNRPSKYRIEDVAPQNGVNYYRVKSIDKSGEKNKTNIKSVTFQAKNNVKVYPSLLDKNSLLTVISEENQSTLEIYNSNGVLVTKKSLFTSINQVELDNINQGMYIYVLKSENNVILKSGKLFIQ